MDERYEYREISHLASPRDIQALFRDVYGVGLDLNFLEAKYGERTDGMGAVGYLAYCRSTGAPVSLYAVIPMVIKVANNSEVVGAQSGDTMTSAKHRGQGLFRKLAVMTYKLARTRGIRLVFGFPNPSSYPVFKTKLNWKFPYLMQVTKWFLPFGFAGSTAIDPQRVVRQFALRGFEVQSLLDSGIHRNTSSSHLRNEKVLALRTKDFVVKKWGQSVWLSLDEDCLKIGDVTGFNLKFIKKLIWLLQFFLACASAGVKRVTFYYSPSLARLLGVWRLFGATKQSLPFGYLALDDDLGLSLDSLSFVYGDYDTF